MFTFWYLFAFPFKNYECVRLWSKPTKISIITIRCEVEHFTRKCVLIMKLQIENQVKGKGRNSHNPSWPAFFYSLLSIFFVHLFRIFQLMVCCFRTKKVLCSSSCSKKFQMNMVLFCALRCSSSYLDFYNLLKKRFVANVGNILIYQDGFWIVLEQLKR